MSKKQSSFLSPDSINEPVFTIVEVNCCRCGEITRFAKPHPLVNTDEELEYYKDLTKRLIQENFNLKKNLNLIIERSH